MHLRVPARVSEVRVQSGIYAFLGRHPARTRSHLRRAFFAVAGALAHASVLSAQSSMVATTSLKSGGLPATAFSTCGSGGSTATPSPGQSASQFDICTFDAQLLNPVIQTPYYVSFRGLMEGYGMANWDGTVKAKASLWMRATPIGDMVGYGAINASGHAFWQEDIFMTPLTTGAPAPSSIGFDFTCHGLLNPTFTSGLGKVGATGGCSAQVDYGAPTNVSGSCEDGALDVTGTIMTYSQCTGDQRFTQGAYVPMSLRVPLGATQLAGTSPINLQFYSLAVAYADIYGGYYGTPAGIITITSDVSSDADLTSTMRLLGAQVFAADGSDISNQYLLKTANGFVLPAIAPTVTTPEPTTLGLLAVPILLVACGRLAQKRRSGAGAMS